MKKLLTVLIALTALAFASQVWSATIAGIENVTLLDSTGTVSTSSQQFITATSTGSGVVPANHSSIKQVLIDPVDTGVATYVLSVQSGAYIDISFGAPVTGSDELVLFFAGNTNAAGAPTTFDITINGVTSNNIWPAIPLDSNGMATPITDVDGWSYWLSAAVIDLSLFGLAPDEAMDSFRIFLADAGSNYPSLVGAGYIAAVPLPLPVVLFASGLGLLGWCGRSKAR